MLRTEYGQRFFDLSNELVCSFTLDGRIEEVNERGAQVTGYTVDELRSRPWMDFVHPEDRDPSTEIARRAAAGEVRTLEFENRIITKDGQVRHLQWSGVALAERERVFAIARDVTEWRVREHQLEMARRLLSAAERIAGIGSWEWTVGEPASRWSPEFRRMLGVGPDERADLALHRELVHPDDYDEWYATFWRGVREGRGYDRRFRIRTRHGTVIVVHERAEVELDAQGRTVRMHGTVQDVSEQVETTRRLRRMTQAAVEINAAGTAQEALNAATIAARDVIGAHQVLITLLAERDRGHEIRGLWLSDRYAQWRTYDVPPTGEGIYALVVERQRSIRLTQEELEAHPDWRGFGEEAERHPPMRGWLAAPMVSKHGVSLGLIQLSDRYAGDFTADDEQLLVQLAHITATALERVELEERFLQAQRVEAVGRLAAGIIHDFNNTLAVMLVRSELLQATVDDPAVVEHAAELQSAARAAADVARDLLALSRTDPGAKGAAAPERQAPTDVREIVRDVARMAAPMLGQDVRLELELPDEPLPTLLGKGDLHQALMNLVLNARDAVGDAGCIAISARAVDGDLVVQVRDDGIGMDEDTRARIFSPYFTTKADSGGTGLGLAGVQTIIARAGGRIEVQSAPDRGAIFEVHIPHAARAPMVPSAASRALPGGDEAIAVVGRNRSVVAVIEALLTSLGYSVAATRPGGEPELEGAQLVIVEDPDPRGDDRCEIPEGVEVLYVAGSQVAGADELPGRHLLQRPISADELARTVRRILDERRPHRRPVAHLA